MVIAFGSVAFGPAEEVLDPVAEHLFTVNALGALALCRQHSATFRSRGAIAVPTGVVAERALPGAADYSASKAAVSAWLFAVRRERRGRGPRFLELRLPRPVRPRREPGPW